MKVPRVENPPLSNKLIITFNIRINSIDSVKRQGYLANRRTFFSITNNQQRTLQIYAKSEDTDTTTMFDYLSKMYDMKFEV